MIDIGGMISGAIQDAVVKPIMDALGGVADWAGQIPGMAVDAILGALATISDGIARSLGGAMHAIPSAITGGLKAIFTSFFNTVKSIAFR